MSEEGRGQSSPRPASLRLVVAAAAFAVLGATALVLFRPAGGGGPAPSSPGRAPKIAGAFDTIDVARQKTHTRIRRADGGKFKIIAPVAAPADEQAAKAAFDSLAALEFYSVVTDREARYVDLQVDDAQGVHVSVRNNEREVFAFVVGKSAGTGDGTFVRVNGPDAAGAGEVWLVGGDLRPIFDRSPADWRDRSVTTFAAKDAQGIEIAARDGAHIKLRSVAEGAGGRGDWEVVDSSVKIATLDQQAPGDLVTTLSSLKASDFADGVSVADAGLVPPTLVVSVSLRSGGKAVVMVGNPTGTDDVFAKTIGGDAQIFLVKRFNVMRFGLRPVQFRNKILCDISDDEIIEVTVRNGNQSYVIVKDGPRWKATRPPAFEVDSEKVAPFASIFRGWRAPAISEDPPANAVSRPWAEIVGRSKTKTCTVRVGSEGRETENEPAGYFVRTLRSSDVYLVPKWMIDRVVVKLDAIRKT